jgi:hypothetical protein
MRCLIRYDARIPKSISMIKQFDLDREMSGYIIEGTLSQDVISSDSWKEPPHKALANLRDLKAKGVIQEESGVTPIDPKTAKKFISMYGLLNFTTGVVSEAGSAFTVSSEELREGRHLLRRAWEGDIGALAQIRKFAIETLVLDAPDVTGPEALGNFKFKAISLWRFACLLFLKDFALDKLGKCANPECRGPYFVKPRRTQSVCERRSCLDWAQRKFKADWRRKQGRPKGVKKRTNSPRRIEND